MMGWTHGVMERWREEVGGGGVAAFELRGPVNSAATLYTQRCITSTQHLVPAYPHSGTPAHPLRYTSSYTSPSPYHSVSHFQLLHRSSS